MAGWTSKEEVSIQELSLPVRIINFVSHMDIDSVLEAEKFPDSTVYDSI